jgi:hypothetical protein
LFGKRERGFLGETNELLCRPIDQRIITPLSLNRS